MKDRIQKLSGAMMIPIILLVISGFTIGIGAAFASPENVSEMGLTWLIPEGGLAQNIFSLINDVGFTIMGFLPIFFAIGLSFGLAKEEQGWAAISGLFFYIVLNASIGTILSQHGLTVETTTMDAFMANGLEEADALIQSSLYTEFLGIFTYNMSVFGGIISGLFVSVVHNRFFNKELPNALAFFSGVRFVPIVLTLLVIPAAYVLFWLWPLIGIFLTNIGKFIGSSGLFGTFLFGALDKALLPFGLHHLIAFPIEYTSVGGTLDVCGQTYEGVKNIMNAQMGCPEATGYITRNFETGRIIFQFGGFAGIALAIYNTALEENKAKIASLLIPAVVTGVLIGVSEPLEYTFLFVAPILYYAVYVPLAGLSYVLAEIAHISVNGTALIFMFPNIFQMDKVYIFPLIFLIPAYFFIYYFIFKWAILKWDIKTPGRERKNVKLYSKKDYQEKKTQSNGTLEQQIIESLGGKNNIDNVTNCATRLRVNVYDETKVVGRDQWMDELEALGVVQVDKSFQIIYGPRVVTIASKVKSELANGGKDE